MAPQQTAKVVPFSTPGAFSTWPITGDAPDLRTIVQDQAVVIKDQAALIDAYQSWLNEQQAAPTLRPAAYGNGTASASPNGTTLTVSGIAGTIIIGARVAGAGVTTAPTTIVAQQSGTIGGNGVYTTDNPTTCNSAALTFTPPAQPMAWPLPTDAPTLLAIQQDQTSVLRIQSALLQAYLDVLNASQTPAPPTGP